MSIIYEHLIMHSFCLRSTHDAMVGCVSVMMLRAARGSSPTRLPAARNMCLTRRAQPPMLFDRTWVFSAFHCACNQVRDLAATLQVRNKQLRSLTLQGCARGASFGQRPCPSFRPCARAAPSHHGGFLPISTVTGPISCIYSVPRHPIAARAFTLGRISAWSPAPTTH